MGAALLRLAATLTALAAGDPSPPAREKTDWDFALHLLEQKDSYRAIGALKHFAFEREGTEEADRANLVIGRLYSDAGQPQAALFHFRLVADGGAPELRHPARLLFLQEYCLGARALVPCEAALAADAPDPSDLTRFMRAVVDVQLERPLPPERLAGLPPPLAAKVPALLEAADERRNLPLKSPLAAGLLSAVVPGAGQVYDGRPLDGALAFALTAGAGAGSAALALKKDPAVAGSVALGLVALVFYSGGIVNAVTDAYRVNERVYETFFQRLQSRLWPRVTFAATPDSATFAFRFGDEPPQPLVAPAPGEHR